MQEEWIQSLVRKLDPTYHNQDPVQPKKKSIIKNIQEYIWASLVAQMVKNLPAMQKTQIRSPGREDPLDKEMATTPVFLPGEFHGQRSLVGYSPRGHRELDTTE